ncbi:Hypothetical predicted protein [Scomber scombrus]|uniref:Uncharacterized protein n=1 Tax=Scomber scombrus TaxID=13677 RepID=A0AAV1P936_SCOSC
MYRRCENERRRFSERRSLQLRKCARSSVPDGKRKRERHCAYSSFTTFRHSQTKAELSLFKLKLTAQWR